MFVVISAHLLVMYRTCGVHLNSQTHNSLVFDKSLFYSPPVFQRVLFSFITQKPISQPLASPITIFTNLMILAVSYQHCHAVTTLPFSQLFFHSFISMVFIIIIAIIILFSSIWSASTECLLVWLVPMFVLSYFILFIPELGGGLVARFARYTRVLPSCRCWFAGQP